MNINLYLQNAKRSDIWGGEWATRGGQRPHEKWDEPRPGIEGLLAIGHETLISDLLIPTVSRKDSDAALSFHAVRNQWTPAWMHTVYRSVPEQEIYKKSGTVVWEERKCFLPSGAFVSHTTLRNDLREPEELVFRLQSSHILNGILETRTNVGALHAVLPIHMHTALGCTLPGNGEYVLQVPANGSVSFRWAFFGSPVSAEDAVKTVNDALAMEDPFRYSEEDLNRWFSLNVPVLETANEDLKKMYYYRYWLLRRAIHHPSRVIPQHFLKRQCMYESPFGSWYGCPVGLPFPLHILEARWLRDSSTAKDNARNWAEELGDYQNYIQSPIASFADLYAVDPDKNWLQEIYPGCLAYLEPILALSGKPGLAGLPISYGSWLTGAEYQPSFYEHAEPKWDWRQDTEGVNNGLATEKAPLYRLDEICYTAGNLLACAKIAAVLGDTENEAKLLSRAKEIVETLLSHFWCEEDGFFYDIDVRTGKLCRESGCYDSFFPFLWNIAGPEYRGIFDRLFSEEHFWGSFPITTADKTCPMFWFDNCIAGPTASSVAEPHEYGCSWNGTTWPYANSLVLTALGNAAKNEPALREGWLEYFIRYSQMHFSAGDRSLPVIVEHYRNSDGSNFSRVTDYFHSLWIDLFMKYYVGLEITGETLSARPFGKDDFTLTGVVFRRKPYSISQKDGKTEIHML